MRNFFAFLVVVCTAIFAIADVPPLKAPIGEMVEGIACATDPTQTYTLYIPSSFSKDRRWPVLLVFDPRGRSLLAAELFREAAETYGWIIVSSDNTRSDGPWEPNSIALQALWPEIHTRLPADFDRIYAAGFSGGGAVAYVLSESTREVAGIVACGARHFPENFKDNDVPVFSTAGNTDFNYHEMHDVDEFFDDRDNPHRLVIFDGAHTWMPPEVAREAVEWLELVAMQRGLREPDPKLVESLYAADLKTARTLASEGRLLEAARRFSEMERTFNGLRDTGELQRAGEEIKRKPEHKRQRKELKRWNAFERQYLGEMNLQFAELRTAEIIPPVTQMALRFRIDELERRALQPGVEGVTARRALNSLTTGLAFYLPRDFMAAEQYDRLAVSLEIAVQVRDDNPVWWYNLACARARLNRGELAMEALERALELGFNRKELLDSDEDLDSLRDRDDFKQLLVAAGK
jgi:predicted esterase